MKFINFFARLFISFYRSPMYDYKLFGPKEKSKQTSERKSWKISQIGKRSCTWENR